MNYPKPIKLTPAERLTEKIKRLREKQAQKIQELKEQKKLQVERVRIVAKKRVKKAKEPSVRALLAKAQKLVNKYVRERDKDEPCISCQKYEVTSFDAGHFWTQGEHGSLRFNLHNLNKQCRNCNHFKSGNLNEYRLHLIQKIGRDAVDELDAHAHDVKKWTRLELEEIIKTYHI